MKKPESLTLNRKKINVGQASPPAAIPVAAPRASKRPTTRNGVFGIDNISSVTIPTRYRICKIEKYTITYLKERKHTRVSHINYSKHNPKRGDGELSYTDCILRYSSGWRMQLTTSPTYQGLLDLKLFPNTW